MVWLLLPETQSEIETQSVALAPQPVTL
jgi:hypothetical protein